MSFWQAKTTIDPADRLFSTFVREQAGWKCQLKFKCNGTEDFSENKKGLHCCHYHGRTKRTTRFDLDNSDAGCAPCHFYYDEKMAKEDRDEWKEEQLGPERFRNLNIRANFSRVGFKPDKKAELIYVKHLIKNNA